MITATAPGKLVLLGEYAVLRGGTAIVAPVERHARVSIQAAATDHFTLTAPELGLARVPIQIERGGDVRVRCTPDAASLLRPVLAVLTSVNTETPVFDRPAADVAIDTAQFFVGNQKMGLGSSAAVCVALTRALVGYFELPERDRFIATLEAHRRAQANAGSGIDVAASWYGHTLAYTMGQTPRPIALPSDISWLAVWTGTSASTPDLVARVLRAVDGSEPAQLALAQLCSIADSGVEACATHRGDHFLTAVADYHVGLARLAETTAVPLISREHAHLHALTVSLGGAYKFSGAGGGDLGLAFARSGAQLAEIAAAAAAAGFAIIDVAR